MGGCPYPIKTSTRMNGMDWGLPLSCLLVLCFECTCVLSNISMKETKSSFDVISISYFHDCQLLKLRIVIDYDMFID